MSHYSKFSYKGRRDLLTYFYFILYNIRFKSNDIRSDNTVF